MRFLLLAALCLVSVPAKADLFTVNYTGHYDAYQVTDPYWNVATNSYVVTSYAASTFTMTTVVDLDASHYPLYVPQWGLTSVSFTENGFNVGYYSQLREGYENTPGYADASFGYFGGYNVSTTLDGDHIKQHFESAFDYHTSVSSIPIDVDAVLGGTGTGRFNVLFLDRPTGGFYSSTVNFVIDSAAIAGVPELSTWLMLLIGFLGIGLVKRLHAVPGLIFGGKNIAL